MYYVSEEIEEDDRSPETLWDIVDVVMAGASWADLFKDSSLGNFGWAVLDTAALLPLIPSSGYVRRGGKTLIKSEAIAELAKTAKGKRAIKTALKGYKYSDAISSSAIKAIKKQFKGQADEVIALFKKAADRGITGGPSSISDGIKSINPSKKIGTQYTHEIKIKGTYGDWRIYGYKKSNGEWVFDKFAQGLH